MYILAFMPLVTKDVTLAVIAQESWGNRLAVSDDGYDSRGLMQVTCAEWMSIDCEYLYEPEYNIAWGEWFLEEALEYSKGNLYIALQVYNCGPRRYERNNDCGTFYADRVMYHWMPMVEEYRILHE